MTQKDTYNECLRAMFGLRRFGIKLGLETIGNILEGLGNPQTRFRSIHIAGTNGKGSVAASLASVLRAAGYKVGLYTSPHLIHFNERICVNGHPISNNDVVESYKQVAGVPREDRELTFFEFSTAMAFEEFAKHEVDWAIVETGMGGRLDATNIIHPFLSIITNISLEHQSYLGDTLEEIAGEKGGIVKPKVPLVTGATQEIVISTLRSIAKERKARMYQLGEDFRLQRESDGRFTFFGMDHIWRDIRPRLTGPHQADNAALVLAGCELLRENRVELPEDAIRTGLAKVRWPGRLEVVSKSPFVLLDGAHNLAAARNLGKYLSEHLRDRKITLVIGILDDKPYEDMLEHLAPVCDKVIITAPRTGRALPPETLYEAMKDEVGDVRIIPRVGAAFRYAVENTLPDAAVCVAGSLYVVGEAKEEIEKMGLT